MEARFALSSYLKTRPSSSELLLLAIYPTIGRSTTVVFVHQHYVGPKSNLGRGAVQCITVGFRIYHKVMSISKDGG